MTTVVNELDHLLVGSDVLEISFVVDDKRPADVHISAKSRNHPAIHSFGGVCPIRVFLGIVAVDPRSTYRDRKYSSDSQ
jgi:hypothetical protein